MKIYIVCWIEYIGRPSYEVIDPQFITTNKDLAEQFMKANQAVHYELKEFEMEIDLYKIAG